MFQSKKETSFMYQGVEVFIPLPFFCFSFPSLSISFSILFAVFKRIKNKAKVLYYLTTVSCLLNSAVFSFRI